MKIQAIFSISASIIAFYAIHANSAAVDRKYAQFFEPVSTDFTMKPLRPPFSEAEEMQQMADTYQTIGYMIQSGASSDPIDDPAEFESMVNQAKEKPPVWILGENHSLRMAEIQATGKGPYDDLTKKPVTLFLETDKDGVSALKPADVFGKDVDLSSVQWSPLDEAVDSSFNGITGKLLFASNRIYESPNEQLFKDSLRKRWEADSVPSECKLNAKDVRVLLKNNQPGEAQVKALWNLFLQESWCILNVLPKADSTSLLRKKDEQMRDLFLNTLRQLMHQMQSEYGLTEDQIVSGSFYEETHESKARFLVVAAASRITLLTSAVRTAIFANNFIKYYEENKSDLENRPLIAVVGASHVTGMQRLLRNKFNVRAFPFEYTSPILMPNVMANFPHLLKMKAVTAPVNPQMSQARINNEIDTFLKLSSRNNK